MEGKNDSTTFLPLGSKLSEKSKEKEVNKSENIDKELFNIKTDRIHTQKGRVGKSNQ